ncbi:hypothetical protein NBO_73g0026 [Nosema bombycis CQ1]|uniref:Uncharacterized protein n=1 Tax=Nosema bombycis (strain CQ1 / CVCC 102059) TaxID=578461 RepID=R0MH60_NOSB1|nr:hypothetical protein NBO_73g0026 [Nosema bombycis CQ1]|eukprot:EOB13460.1 hypothetical protein NBO_73g0026 [Nosema bombycis CQ1]
MKNNHNSLNGVGNKEDEGYKKRNNVRDGNLKENGCLRDSNYKDYNLKDNYVRDSHFIRDAHYVNNNYINNNYVNIQINNIQINNFYIKGFHYLQQDKKSNLKKYKYLNSVDEMQSAYLCALELTFKFLGVLIKSDQPTTFSKIIVSKGYYHMLRTAFDSIYQKRRRSLFFVGNEKGRRKSLNLDFTKREQIGYEYESSKGYNDRGVLSKGYNDRGVSLKEPYINNQPYHHNKKFKSNFDIISFIINFSSFKNSELPLSREGILGGLREKFGDIPRKLDDDQIELILFGGAHTFVNYKDSPLRDLLQLTYASLRGLTKEFFKLKLLKTPERIEEINLKIKKNQKGDSEYNLLFYVNRYKESVFDLYYFLNKPNLDKQEIEIFNKIIYWLTCLKKELPQEEVQMISNRVKIDLFFYSKQYTIIVEFIESIL